jgi:4-hydroxy-tetrahydrodipicolinate synthase
MHYRLSPLIDALFIETNPIPVKAALAMMGKISYDLRLPLCRMQEKNEAALRKVMQEYGLIG